MKNTIYNWEKYNLQLGKIYFWNPKPNPSVTLPPPFVILLHTSSQFCSNISKFILTITLIYCIFFLGYILDLIQWISQSGRIYPSFSLVFRYILYIYYSLYISLIWSSQSGRWIYPSLSWWQLLASALSISNWIHPNSSSIYLWYICIYPWSDPVWISQSGRIHSSLSWWQHLPSALSISWLQISQNPPVTNLQAPSGLSLEEREIQQYLLGYILGIFLDISLGTSYHLPGSRWSF